MNNFTENEIILIVTTIINSKKEEEFIDANNEEVEYMFPIGINNKLDKLDINEYVKFISLMEKISDSLYEEYMEFEGELDSLNKLHEKIIYKYDSLI